MIPNNVKRGVVTNNLGATKRRELTVDTANMQHIMGLLTNIYSDEELACLREYSTNAWDAQLDCGITTPILVSTPTRLAPFLKIKDNGTGMSADTLIELYTMYGASTKRDREDANGFMGIGGKAALAYGDQFTITSVKDGIKTTASISRLEDDSAVIDIIDESETDEGNGTEIVIPAKNWNSFDEKAQDLFKFWPEGTVLINGKEPKRDDLEKMTERIFFHDGDDDLIVMGNVAYPLDRKYVVTDNGRKVAVFVTMNGDDEVVIHPSRERLIYNGITTNVLAGIREEFAAKIKGFIEDGVNGAANFVEAFRLLRKYREQYGSKFTKDITYNGLDLSDEKFTYDDGGIKREYTYTSWRPGAARNTVQSNNAMTMGNLNSAKAIIVGYTGYNGVSSNHKSRVREYLEAQGVSKHDYGYYSFIMFYRENTLPEPAKTSGFEVYKWSDVLAATKKPAASRGGGFSYGGRYDVYDPDNGWTVDAVDSQAEILFFSHTETNLDPTLRDRILDHNPDIVFVKATVNRHTKLQREYPNARPYEASEWIKKFAAEDFDKLTDNDLAIMRAREIWGNCYYYDRSKYGVTDVPAKYAALIADPEYRDAVVLYTTTQPVLDYAVSDPRFQKKRVEWGNERNKVTKFGKKYPLMNWDSHPAETLAYVNAIYNQTKEK